MSIPVVAETAVGDWGHFLRYQPKVYLNNPTGKAFTVTVHPFRWNVVEWEKNTVEVKVTGPDGKVVFDEDCPVEGIGKTISFAQGAKGVYLVEVNKTRNIDFWLESSLDQSVVWTGEPHTHAVEQRHFIINANVPRRWWFWVPEGTKTFSLYAQRIGNHMSQREDYGFTVFSPRGQRMKMLWGQPLINPDPRKYHAEDSITVEVEPGADGRFWALEVRYGDGHNHSKPNVALEGVPPYLSRSPEEWFNPETGERPAINLYDDDPYMQSAMDERNKAWPGLQHWTPCPSLGDPDGIELRGDIRFALWNPEGRELLYRFCDYLPHSMKNPGTGQVKIRNARGITVFDQKVTLPHQHDPRTGFPTDIFPAGKGVFKAEVQAERFFFFSYPATPLVWIGRETKDGWQRFTGEVGTARNWYFLVPKGTKRFSVRAAAEHDTDVLSLEVNTPDRTMAMIYGHTGEVAVDVPAGLDGKIWHLRADVGSATRMITAPGPDCRYVDIYATIDLKGIPGYLAPTWEQWFDPEKPAGPDERK